MRKFIVILIIVMSIPLFACAKRNGFYYNNEQNVFYLDNKPFFPYGWYISRSHDYIKLAAGVDNKFGFSDPFNDYYNTFLVYTLYNDVYTLDNRIIDKKLSYLKEIPGKYFIVDIPRELAQFRLFYRETSTEMKNIPRNFIESYQIGAGSTVEYNLKACRTPDDSVESLYWFETLSNFDIIKSSFTDFYFSKGNAIVYRKGHLLNFAVKATSLKPRLSIVIDITGKSEEMEKSLHFHIVNDNRDFIRTLGKDIYSYRIDTDQLEEWKLFTLDIKKCIEETFELQDYEIENITLFANNILMSTPSISYNKIKRNTDIRRTIDRVLSYNTGNILGFYLSDEIEWQAMFDYCKWQSPVNNQTDRYGEGLVSLCSDNSKYIEGKGFTPFILSTPYVKQDGDLAMFDRDYEKLRNEFIMFDHYSYLEPYVNDFKSIRNYADHNNLGILFVADAYETDTKSVISFENTLFKIISSLTLGAKGLLFYTYNSPHTTDAQSFMNDKSKLHIGIIGKFLTDYHIVDMILNKPHYISRDNAHFVYGYDDDNNMIILCYRENTNINFLFDYIGQYVKETMQESLDNKLILDITPGKCSNMKMDYFPLVFSGGVIEQSRNIFTENRKVAVLIIPDEPAASFSYDTEFVDGTESLIIKTDYPQLIEKFTIISGDTSSAEYDFNNSYNSYITKKYLPLRNLYKQGNIIIEYTDYISKEHYDTIIQ